MLTLEHDLYSRINRLTSSVPNQNERGTLIGYAIINSLLDFSSNSNSQEELKFGQVKAIYAGLDEVRDISVKTDWFDAFCGFCDKVNTFLSTGQYEGKTSLLQNYVVNLRTQKTNYEDNLRRSGIALENALSERGKASGNTSDILKADYSAVEEHFILRR